MPLPLLGSSGSRCNCGGIIFAGNKRNRSGPLPGHLVHGNLGYTKDNSRVIFLRILDALGSFLAMIAEQSRNEACAVKTNWPSIYTTLEMKVARSSVSHSFLFIFDPSVVYFLASSQGPTAPSFHQSVCLSQVVCGPSYNAKDTVNNFILTNGFMMEKNRYTECVIWKNFPHEWWKEASESVTKFNVIKCVTKAHVGGREYGAVKIFQSSINWLKIANYLLYVVFCIM